MGGKSPIHVLFKPVPEPLRDAFVLDQYIVLRRQLPLLYTAVLFMMPVAMLFAEESASPMRRFALPLAIAMFVSVRLVRWLRAPLRLADVGLAVWNIRQTTVVCMAMVAICSGWSLDGWLTAPQSLALGYVLMMSMGALAATFCMSVLPVAALGCLLLGFMPLVAALLLKGDEVSLLAALSLLATGTFLLGLLRRQHEDRIELLALRQEMRDLARTDALTGLFNRRALDQYLENAVPGYTLMLIDLDGFKPINDTHGHAAGDAMLCEIARRLTVTHEFNCLAFRLGGDEFAIVTDGTAADGSNALAANLRDILGEPFYIDDMPISVGASIGIARHGIDGTSGDQLQRAADLRLYADKTARRMDPGLRRDAVTQHAPIAA